MDGTESRFHYLINSILDLSEILIHKNERAYLKYLFDRFNFNRASTTTNDLECYVKECAQLGGIRGGINAYRVLGKDVKDNLVKLGDSGRCKVKCFLLEGEQSDYALQGEEVGLSFYENSKTVTVQDSGHHIAEEMQTDS